MPVVTRSCGRQAAKRRIEDTTPRRPCKTTVKRKKKSSSPGDKESEKPAKKKTNLLTVRLDKIGVTPSRIPRKCTTKKVQEKENDSPLKDLHTTPTADESSPNSPTSETPSNVTPVAARTRSFSALKRSYIAKKSQRNRSKTIHNSSSSEEEMNGVSAMNETKMNEPCNSVEGVVSSNNGSKDVEMIEDQENNEEMVSDKQTNNDFYKAKFHQMLQQLKSIQETFASAQKNATKNIEAYDALIKELKESLEKEKTKVTNTTQELRMTKDQLLIAQEKLDKTSKECSETNIQLKTSNSLVGKDDNFQSMINFYQMLSGICLTEETDSVQSFESYRCVYKPKGVNGKAMQFNLTYDKEIDEVEFSPVVQTPSTGEFLQKMPKFLRENIYFSTDQAPAFLLRVIQSYQKQH